MHIYFSGIGGAGIGPLAMVALEAGYSVSGSDKQPSQYIEYLRAHGIENIHIGQSREAIEKVHTQTPIDWFVYTSALPLENPNAPELLYCDEQHIKATKRDELLNQILQERHLKLIAVAGTHGKTTTTAMTVWLCTQLNIPISYLLPAKTSFAELGTFNKDSTYFVYEADEFDRNFLAFRPAMSLITGVSWDHHEIFPSREDYQEAFREFIGQSQKTFIWQEDNDYLGLPSAEHLSVLQSNEPKIQDLTLYGQYNRLDAWLAIQAVHSATKAPLTQLIELADRFPGLQRRMERIIPNLYSDYAHTPEKIRGCISVASEMSAETGQKLIALYEPLTNRRQHYMLHDYKDCFQGVDALYWLPSYLAREDRSQRIIDPQELIDNLDDPSIARPMKRDKHLNEVIQQHLDNGDMVVGIAGGGGNSLDDWLRSEFQSKT
jgi:UDP-N-acetylmuramate--alanine ligase